MLILATPLLEHRMSGYPHTEGTTPLTGTPIHATEYKPLCRHTPPLKGTPLSAPARSVEINTASSGVSLLRKTLIFCAMLILVTPLLEHLSLLRCTLKRSTLPVAE